MRVREVYVRRNELYLPHVEPRTLNPGLPYDLQSAAKARTNLVRVPAALHPAQPVECRCDVKRVRSIREGPLWWCDSGATTRAEMPMRQMPVGVNKCRLVWSLSYAFMEVSSPVGDRRDEPSD